MHTPRLEITVDHPEAMLAACRGGAERIELCASLADGGLTPSLGWAVWARASTRVPLHAMVRPRTGNFVYSDAELAVIERDLLAMQAAGVDGIVLGVLSARNEVDVPAMRALVAAAHPMRVVFHRAFDLAPDLDEALEQVIACGAHVLLTSGGAPTLELGLPSVSRLVDRARGRIEIMGGSGVRLANAARLWERSGIDTLHASLRSPWPRASQQNSTGGATMGSRDADELYTVREDDVRAMVSALTPREKREPLIPHSAR